MTRRAALVLGFVGLAAAVRAGADEPGPAPVSSAEWEARDAEARWLLYRRSEARHEDWIAFLEGRRETGLLETIALTSRRGEAVAALRRLDAPQWVRCAVWNLGATDTHALGAARTLLDGRAPLVLAWFDLHPEAVTDPAEAWWRAAREKVVAREDASRLLPPFDPAALLADLTPGERLHDLGDAPRADPARDYVHQVERAIEILVAMRWPGEPWAGRLTALLGNGHPAVRRAAALAWAHAPAASIPLAALEARLDDAAERAEVRAAALLGLSWSDDPRAYAVLLRVAGVPTHPAWSAAVSRLGDLDDGFAPTTWRDLDLRGSAPDAAAHVAANAARIRDRTASLDAEGFADRVSLLFARAAQVDLACDPLEGSLVPWTISAVRARSGEPPVRRRLEALRDAPSAHDPRPHDTAREERVREYARSALEPAPPAGQGR